MSGATIMWIGAAWAIGGGFVAGAAAGWMGILAVIMVALGVLGACIGQTVREEESNE